MIGTAIGSIVGQVYLNECLALTAGGFLYFSINGFMTELKKVGTFGELVNCFISSSFGMYIMYLIALNEWNIILLSQKKSDIWLEKLFRFIIN